jgi:hypothetical protein
LLWKKGKHGGWQVKGYCDEDEFEPHLISLKLIQKILAAPSANENVELMMAEEGSSNEDESDN